jgi:hypothetical protein
MKSLPRSLVVLALAAVPAAAQIQPGRVYNGGEQIRDPESGLTLTLPAGWRGALSGDASSFVMESESGGGYLVVLADQLTEADARTQLGQPVDLGGGVTLMPSGEIREIATGHLSAGFAVSGAAAEMVATVDVRLTQSGLGVAFVLLSPPASAESHTSSMREFALSLGVTEASAQATHGGDEWEPYLRGRYLARFFTRTGYTESAELWLCSDGSFWLNDQSGGFGGGASGAFQRLGGGQWSATGAGANGTLHIRWSDGNALTWPLEYDYDQDRLYINGERFLRGENERCS